MRRFKGECEHFRFNKCPIYTHDGASDKFSTNSQEMDNSVYSILIHTGKGGGKQLNQREREVGNSSQSWVENTNMIDCISSL